MNRREHKPSVLSRLGTKLSFDKKELLKPGNLSVVSKELKHVEDQKKKQEEHDRKKEAEEQRKLIAEEVKKPAQEKHVELEPPLPKQKKQRKKRTLKELLVIAGMDVEPHDIYKRLFLTATIITLVLTAFTLIIAFFFNATFDSFGTLLPYLGFMAAVWTAGFAFILIACALAFAVYIDLRINQRRKEIEAVFPDYLQLAAANLSAGMTIDRALWSAIRPRFGILAKEMEDVAKKTMTGYDLERALHEFSDKYDSVTIKRSVNLIIEGIHSGGRLADILNKIAVNMQENAILQKEMAANVTTYVIFISFASVAAAPFLFGLSTQLLLVIKSIAGNLSGGGSFGLQINPEVISEKDFRIFAVVVLSASSVMSACIVSVIRKGTVKDGLRLLPFFWVATVGLYFIASWGLGFMFSGLV